MKIGIIVQARMGSTRLPGKVLRPIGSKNLLEHIFYRLSYLEHNCLKVIATSDMEQDEPISEFCKMNGIYCFRGSEKNVLRRYYECAQQYEMDHIVRLTGDNPFPDIEEIDRLIKGHIHSRADYSKSFEALPIGVGAEIFTFHTLETSFLKGHEPHHIEHVNEYIWDNLDAFKVQNLLVDKAKNFPDVRLTVDTQDDYEKACFIVEKCPNQYVSTVEAINLCLRYV